MNHLFILTENNVSNMRLWGSPVFTCAYEEFGRLISLFWFWSAKKHIKILKRLSDINDWKFKHRNALSQLKFHRKQPGIQVEGYLCIQCPEKIPLLREDLSLIWIICFKRVDAYHIGTVSFRLKAIDIFCCIIFWERNCRNSLITSERGRDNSFE